MKPRASQRGSSLPETAIVLAVLLALLFGIIDFGRAVYTYSFVAQLARQGARWAIVRGNQCSVLDHCNAQQTDVQTYVRSLSEGPTSSGNTTATTIWGTCPAGTSGNNAPGCTVTVTVTYPFKFLLPFMPGGNLATLGMSSSSQMVISQ
jgi:Flp pilus assembly protein TadG